MKAIYKGKYYDAALIGKRVVLSDEDEVIAILTTSEEYSKIEFLL